MEEKKRAQKAKAKGETVEKSDPAQPKKAYTKVNLNDYFNSVPD